MTPSAGFGYWNLTLSVNRSIPEGRFRKLGEVYLNGDDARLQASTELQEFGMIVTVEPYYAVTQPSQNHDRHY